ncbi:hypothetical protein OC861_005824 [Tilletia horrida]|nr:hypothetical protein OC861_005824 [Tilletia horrida]
MNFVKAEATPVVFRELDHDGRLHWAGSLTINFDPASLVVDSETGYLYHPSPNTAIVDGSSPSYGTHSLLSSALVQEHFASSLEYGSQHEGAVGTSALPSDSSSVEAEEVAGSIEWRGRRWNLGCRT